MLTWELFVTVISLVTITCLQLSVGKVTLKVLLHPPMVTLECLIMNPVEKVSAIMECPSNILCFQSCTRQCRKDCSKNKITCTETKINNGLLYRYVFDTTNPQNQGEWTCHFGSHQSSTVLFFNETNPTVDNSISSKVTAPISTSNSTAKLLLPLNDSSTLFFQTSNLKKGYPIIKPIYVIILLALFAVSLFINVVLIIRAIITHHSLSKKNYFKSEELREKSCIQKFCIRFFCAASLYRVNRHRGNHHKTDGKALVSPQVSNNIYECSSYLQPAILLDNCAYISPVANHRLLSQSMYARSHSFPAKTGTMDPRLSTLITEPTRLKADRSIPSRSFTMIPATESVSQIIYDDVADQVAPPTSFSSYRPHHSCFFNSLSSPYAVAPSTDDYRCNNVAMSLNNLSSLEDRLQRLGQRSENYNDESTLKDAINSRVELSKEMISHADTLLRRADSLLNERSLPALDDIQ